MSSNLNKVFLMGRIGNDLELKQSAQGEPYLTLSLATDSYRGSNQPKTTHWHRVVMFGKLAENCAKHLGKGSEIVVEGSLEVRLYTDKDKKKRSSVSVIASNVQFTSRSKIYKVADEELVEELGDAAQEDAEQATA